jgi:hypothetical protein
MVTEAFPCPETIWLAEVLRGEPRWPPQNMDKNAIQRVLTAANSNDVQELLFTKLHSNSIWEQLPDRLRQRLHDAHRHAIARELFLQEETAKDLDALAAAGIDVLLLKGTALAYNLYASPALRPRRDVDLLMHDKSTAHKAWHLLEQRGYTRGDAIGGDLISHEYCCARKVPPSAGVVLDVHWKLSNSHFFAQKFSYDELRCKRVPVPMLGSGAYALGAVHALIHALFHRAWSLGGNEPDRLIWLYDIDLLCRHLSREQWDEFALLVATRDLGPICREGLERARECYNTPIPNGGNFRPPKTPTPEIKPATGIDAPWTRTSSVRNTIARFLAQSASVSARASLSFPTLHATAVWSRPRPRIDLCLFAPRLGRNQETSAHLATLAALA